MIEFVPVSEGSRDLIKELSGVSDDPIVHAWNDQKIEKMLLKDLVQWLQQTVDHSDKTRLLLEDLRASLLQDLHEAPLNPDTYCKQNEIKSSGWFAKTKFYLVVIAGAILALCAGFSGIAAVLNTFILPVALVVGVSAVFAAVSLAFFYNFERVEMAKILGVKLRKSRYLLDICVNQVEQIKMIRKDIDDCYAKTTDVGELQALHEMVKMLNIRYTDLDDVRRLYNTKLKNPYLKTVKIAMAIVEGGLVLAAGFFAGQSLALVIAGFFVASVAVTFWPIAVAGIALGLAALVVYGFVERSGYENRVGHLLGFDQVEIDMFAGGEIVGNQKRKLQRLEGKVADKIQYQQHIEQLTKQIDEIGINKPTTPATHHHVPTALIEQKLNAASSHSFFKRSYSMNDLRADRSQNEIGINWLPNDALEFELKVV